MAKHHIVQDKYLAQWAIDGTKNHLNVYLVSENKKDKANSKSPIFWRKDYNVFYDNGVKTYIPEEIASKIDGKGISAIRKIDTKDRIQLSGYDRSCLAFYLALQYIRTPRYREESNKIIEASVKHFMRKDISSVNEVKMTKEDIFNEGLNGPEEERLFEEIKMMSDEDIQKIIFDTIHSNDTHIHVTKEGHSKSILKVGEQAKELFEIEWVFIIAPKGTSFVTSDSPYFTIGPKVMNGQLSPHSMGFFPLRPDLCICTKPRNKTKAESFIEFSKSQVRQVNQLVLKNSYNCLVAKDKAQIDHLTKAYDYSNHRKSRDVTVSENGPYVLFNIE